MDTYLGTYGTTSEARERLAELVEMRRNLVECMLYAERTGNDRRIFAPQPTKAELEAIDQEISLIQWEYAPFL